MRGRACSRVIVSRIERCLFTARTLEEEDKVIALLYECATQPFFLGISAPLVTLGYLAEVVEEFGWEKSFELVFNLGAKLVGQGRGEPDLYRRDAVRIMTENQRAADAYKENPKAAYDEDAFVEAVTSVDLDRSFSAVVKVLQEGVSLERIATTFVLLAADRMARTPVNVEAGWHELASELSVGACLRAARRHAGEAVAARGVFQAAWQIFEHRWINIPNRALSEALVGQKLDAADTKDGVAKIIELIENVGALGMDE